ncbi:helix-turn-helix domain-containing protein [Marinobacterium lutimaris]|uniref:Transcriptional regulator, XRE family with cupin sensor n=1 Tax=Marinobacterium lutimaris TaxID=568106 RepID=A0A1H6DU10_9GAMM|nr:XRE family transcriptional regulator [Marinobacterium lutimaris]SEG88872.1 transcriptional regulator, XRE family with cupin sensor [Marinobacterium lutimaris]
MSIDEKVEAVSKQLGRRIRASRREKNFTLESLSERTGLSASFLSRLERGETNASISNLIAISDRLGIALRELFDRSPEDEKPDFSVSRTEDRQRSEPLKGKGYTFRPLSGFLLDQKMSAFELSYLPGESLHSEMLTHKGEEILYLLEGSLEFEIDGNITILEPGDCVHFNCEKPHRGKNIGEGTAHLLMVVTPVDSMPI